MVQTKKPKVQRAYVTAKDPDSKRTKSFTVYNMTPEQFKAACEGSTLRPRRAKSAP